MVFQYAVVNWAWSSTHHHARSLIFLNEWFAIALENEQQFSQIVQFVGSIADFSSYDKYKNYYQIMQFSCAIKGLRAVLGDEIESSTATCLKAFCEVSSGEMAKKSMPVCKMIGGKTQINSEVETLDFHVLRPIIFLLENKSVPLADVNETKENSTVDPTEQEKKQKKDYTLIAARNIVANCDVQRYMKLVIDIWYDTYNEERGFILPIFFYEDLYKELNTWLNGLTHRTDEGIIYIYKNEVSDKTVINTLFLSNNDNLRIYIREFSFMLNYLLLKTMNLKSRIPDIIERKDVVQYLKIKETVNDLQRRVDDALQGILLGREKLKELANIILCTSKSNKDEQTKKEELKKNLAELEENWEELGKVRKELEEKWRKLEEIWDKLNNAEKEGMEQTAVSIQTEE